MVSGKARDDILIILSLVRGKCKANELSPCLLWASAKHNKSASKTKPKERDSLIGNVPRSDSNGSTIQGLDRSLGKRSVAIAATTGQLPQCLKSSHLAELQKRQLIMSRPIRAEVMTDALAASSLKI